MSLYPDQCAHTQLQLSLIGIVSTPLLSRRRQCQRRPVSVAPDFHAESSSPQTAGDPNISNYTTLNTFELHPRTIGRFAGRPDPLNLLCIVNSTLKTFS
jgi:hypothetical protein